MQEIYKDDKRTISRNGGRLVIHNARGTRDISLYVVKIENRPDAESVAQLRKMGEDPANWYALVAPLGGGGSRVEAVMPNATRDAVAAAIKAYHDEIEAARKDPANVERRRIDALYAEADKAEFGDYCDYGLACDLRNEADAALKVWRETYTDAARKERISSLEADAQEFDSLAVGALVYDADGSISSEEQERRAAEFRTKAAAKRAEAARLEQGD